MKYIVDDKPFFSIIIPTYNREIFIGATLDSIMNQKFKSVEVLVVDDGSEDDTAKVVGKFTSNSVHYYYKENAERGAARNYGFKKAKGEYVLFLDSDDVLKVDHLTVLYNKIMELKYPNFIATKYDFNRNGKVVSSGLKHFVEGWYAIDDFIQGNFLACNVCVKRENIRLYLFEEDRRYAAVEDWMFMLQNTQIDRIYLVDAITLTMNDHDQRSMRADNKGLIKRLDLAGQWMKQHLALTVGQRRRLLGKVYYLCAIHAHIDGYRAKALGFTLRALPGLPILTGAALVLRSITPPSAVQWAKRLLKR